MAAGNVPALALPAFIARFHLDFPFRFFIALPAARRVSRID